MKKSKTLNQNKTLRDKFLERENYNIFYITFLLIIILITGYIYLSYSNNNILIEPSPKKEIKPITYKHIEELCPQLEGVPAFFDGKTLTYGYNNKITIDYLIENEIYYFYKSNCLYCIKQQELWKDDYLKLKTSGYAINCGI